MSDKFVITFKVEDVDDMTVVSCLEGSPSNWDVELLIFGTHHRTVIDDGTKQAIEKQLQPDQPAQPGTFTVTFKVEDVDEMEVLSCLECSPPKWGVELLIFGVHHRTIINSSTKRAIETYLQRAQSTNTSIGDVVRMFNAQPDYIRDDWTVCSECRMLKNDVVTRTMLCDECTHEKATVYRPAAK